MIGSAESALQLVALFLLNVGLAGAVGALVCRASLHGAGSRCGPDRRPELTNVLRGSLVLLAVATLIALWVETALMSERPLLEVNPAVWSVVTQTHCGHAWVAGMLALCAVLASSFVWRDRSPLAGRLPLGAIAVFAVSRSLVSHAGASGRWLPLAVDGLHLISTSVWAGMVLVAVATTLPSRTPASTDDRDNVSRFVSRLSTTATWALIVVIGTGAFSGWRGLHGSLEGLRGSGWGNVLIVKLVLVAVSASLGGFNRFAVMPGLLEALLSSQSSTPFWMRRFVLVLRVESIALLGVLLAAALLAMSEPTPPLGQ